MLFKPTADAKTPLSVNKNSIVSVSAVCKNPKIKQEIVSSQNLIDDFLINRKASNVIPAIKPKRNLGKIDINGFWKRTSTAPKGGMNDLMKEQTPNAKPATVPSFQPNIQEKNKTTTGTMVMETKPNGIMPR